MRIERVTDPEIVNKLFRLTKIQKVLSDFSKSEDKAIRVILEEGEYTSIRTAQTTYHSAIKRSGYSMAARTLNGELYLIKI